MCTVSLRGWRGPSLDVGRGCWAVRGWRLRERFLRPDYCGTGLGKLLHWEKRSVELVSIWSWGLRGHGDGPWGGSGSKDRAFG
jgi:hypothetical protein